MKQNKAKRIQLLEHKSPAELVHMLELMGHFDSINADIQWLENQVKQEGKANG
jgi:hypothetical protein